MWRGGTNAAFQVVAVIKFFSQLCLWVKQWKAEWEETEVWEEKVPFPPREENKGF